MTARVQRSAVAIGGALVALAFVAGVISGVAGERFMRRRQPTPRQVVIQDLSPVLDRLSLTDEQHRLATAILARRATSSRTAMIELSVKLRSVADSVDGELRAILTPAQRARLDSLRPRTTFVLKREDSTGATTVDTVYPAPKR